jgi:hypothetical protein
VTRRARGQLLEAQEPDDGLPTARGRESPAARVLALLRAAFPE